MNIYLIEQTENNHYDTYDSAVVVAASEEEAKSLHPSGDQDDWEHNRSTWCDGPGSVKITLVGVATDGVARVICSSYNAG